MDIIKWIVKIKHPNETNLEDLFVWFFFNNKLSSLLNILFVYYFCYCFLKKSFMIKTFKQ